MLDDLVWCDKHREFQPCRGCKDAKRHEQQVQEWRDGYHKLLAENIELKKEVERLTAAELHQRNMAGLMLREAEKSSRELRGVLATLQQIIREHE